jgi:hypothetical protein
MPQAIPFMALGVGNGFPFCIQRVTSGVISAIAGEDVNEEDVALFKVCTMQELSSFFWNLESVGFPDITYNDLVLTFDDSDFGYGAPADGGVNANFYLQPYQRSCVSNMTMAESSPFSLGSYWGAAQSQTDDGGAEYVRFSINGLFYNVTTEEYLLCYSSALYADDSVTLLEAISIDDLTFNYYTYPNT